jgi:CspA family cold shock protein
MNTEESVNTTSDRLTGKVKWFNNKAGYGFITMNYGEHANKDIFVHFSSINVSDSQYKYLIQGEYVEFRLVNAHTDKHEYQATDISGIKGGELMCETQKRTRSERPARTIKNYKPRSSEPPPHDNEDSSSNKRDTVNIEGGRNNGGFTKVVRRRKPKATETKA